MNRRPTSLNVRLVSAAEKSETKKVAEVTANRVCRSESAIGNDLSDQRMQQLSSIFKDSKAQRTTLSVLLQPEASARDSLTHCSFNVAGINFMDRLPD